MQKYFYYLILIPLVLSCASNRITDQKNCKRLSISDNFISYEQDDTKYRLIEAVEADSVEGTIYRILSEFHQSYIDSGIPPSKYIGDERTWQQRTKDQAKGKAIVFLSHYAKGDQIWIYNNFDSEPGIVGGEYGLLIISSCLIKWTEPILTS